MTTRASFTVMSAKGEKIFGMRHYPQSGSDFAVLICHGFASHKIGLNRCYVHLSEALARAGIAAVRFDFRGCGDSEGNLAQMLPSDFVDDILCVKRNFPDYKWGLFGSSFGGSVAVLAAKKDPDFQSIALWAPVANGVMWHSDQMEKDLSQYKGVEISENFQREFGALRADVVAGELNIPLLHMHGENDEVISLKHQEAFKEARKETSFKSIFMTYPDTRHQMGSSKDLPKVLQTITEWYKDGKRQF